ncbi:MAG: IPT/TIG domain-containing protein [Akkermansiaceae bacterium]|nr:IPT/TIG domain-containing protein [Akkermansiaceae bacterium]
MKAIRITTLLALVVPAMAAPVITDVTGTATTQGATTMTIVGTGLSGGGTSIHFATNVITPTSISGTAVTFVLPEGQGTLLPIYVKVGGVDSNTYFFSYDPPAIGSLSPTKGLAVGGSILTIDGSNFGTAPTVTMDGMNAPVQTSSHIQLTVTTPATSGGPVDVVVAAGGQFSSPAVYQSVALTSPPGYYIDLENEVVVPAPAGRYVSEENATQATLCPYGYYTPVDGMRAAIPASPGYFVDSIGAESQTPAPAGRYSSVPASTGSFPTTPGFYTPFPGMRAAIQASPGYFVSTSMATSQSPATPGRFVSSAGATSEESALPGHYAPFAAMTGAIAAPPGRYVSNSDATSTLVAPAGRFAAGFGSTSTTAASPGHYVPHPGMGWRSRPPLDSSPREPETMM